MEGDPIKVTIGQAEDDGHTVSFFVYPDHVHLADPYGHEVLELSRAVLLDLADALAIRMAQDRH